MFETDRRSLTAGVLRIANSCGDLARCVLVDQWSIRVFDATPPEWMHEKLWDGNEATVGIRFGMCRALLAAAEQARGLYELSRSTRGYTVALATLTRSSVEALARVYWVATSANADELLARHASVEFTELRYPAQHRLSVHNVNGRTRTPVDEYRGTIDSTLTRHGVSRARVNLTDLTTGMLGEIYNEPRELYSGLSASAHAYGWATANFYSTQDQTLRLDDQMLIEYCEYVIDSMVHVVDHVVRFFIPDTTSVDRWATVRDQVFAELDSIIKRRPNDL